MCNTISLKLWYSLFAPFTGKKSSKVDQLISLVENAYEAIRIVYSILLGSYPKSTELNYHRNSDFTTFSKSLKL
jgi:hypothetical protein